METLQSVISIREDTGPLKKPLADTKERCKRDDHGETNYVDLGNPSDMKSDSTKTVKVTFTGEGNQLAIFRCKGDASISGIKSPGQREETGNADKSSPKSCHADKCHSEGLYGERAPLTDDYVDAGTDVQSEDPTSESYETEELQYTDMYLNSRCESKDSTSVADVEPHYITTREIQLTELDHDVDYEFGRGSCWDLEDDNLVYSFVDYASFDSVETSLGRIQSKSKSNKIPPTARAAKLSATGALVSTESELCESDKCASSDEGAGQQGNSAGHVHLSIKTSSRAVNAPAGVLGQRNVRFHTRRTGERSHYSFKSSDSKSETMFDRYFIPPPGRQHLASKLRGKDINEYSSGASSSVSELDDADKEVRNLTARSFRSLACPYFDTIHLSSSSESSISEHGLSINKWSAFVDLNYVNLTREAQNNSTPVMEVDKSTECTNLKDVVQTNTPSSQTKIVSMKNNLNSQQASKKIELRSKPGETITLTETFNCNVGIPARERRAKRALNAMMSRSTADVTGTTPANAGCEAESPFGETLEDAHKKAIFASSLLKNVISKKMQFEQERKMERGEICDTYPVPSVSPHAKNCKETVKGLQRQTSETDSGHSQEELGDTTDQPQENSCSGGAKITDSPCDPEMTSKLDLSEPLKTSLTSSQKSAFKTWKDGEQEAQGDGESQCAPEESSPLPDTSIRPVTESSESVEGESSKMIKMSHLYVPSSQLMPKEKEAAGISLHNMKVTGDLAESDGGGCRKVSSGQLHSPVDTDQTTKCQKAPEIKIQLRSVKENKSNQFNITSLFTPNIHHNLSANKATIKSKSNLSNISDKVPHFMVRDIRDSKCKFQTPIHQVRDVRKLVKSSYRFVALEDPCGSSETASTGLREESKPVNREPVKKPFPTPMVIKCQSVYRNNATKPSKPANMDESVGEMVRLSPNLSEWAAKNETLCTAPGLACAKQPVTEQPEFILKINAKVAKQKQEKAAEGTEKKPESKASNQIALEKLKAAVKTMEELYVFDRNEWKRKTKAPRPITDSHVLSLITREEQGVTTKTDSENEYGKVDTSLQLHAEKSTVTSSSGVDEDKVCIPTGSHDQEDTAKLVTQKADSFNDKCIFSLGSNLKAPTRINTPNDSTQQMSSSRNYTLKSYKSEERHQKEQPDSDNYLTIPIKAHTSDSKPSQALGSHPKPSYKPLQRSPIVMESWSPDSQTATIYHHAVPLPPVPAAQPQLLCLTPPTDLPPHHIQRKLLLDPATGQYYLVDTPVSMQPAAQCFYHPETGQYLDIPLSLTPVPVSVSPVTLGPAAAYPPTYLVYPSNLPAPHLHPVPQSQSSTCSEGEDVVETGSMYLIPQGTTVPRSTTKPVISITSQQGARIVAPPSFDGTTMSFVVEHR
ncbi:DNA repair protein complementing XP-A cells isoform X1 [Carassius carassius]|uniref:DNA repair protein complementing XP-A cells isoform X1 n=1 Tax=Carassius carassius TaxID=217509 RepID=UPI0028683BA9|nr:DNA repair protein complementing XP-A cells isoform X1 [Carassius carassius]